MDEMHSGYDNVNANEPELENNITNGEESAEDVIISTEQEIPNIDSEELTSSSLSEDDPLAIPMKEFEELQRRAENIEREENYNREEASVGKKLCATRHGCQGATDCNYSYGAYPD